MARYGIVARHAFGVPMGTLLSLRKRLGQDQALSLALWESGWYEARLLAALVGDPRAGDAPADERVGRRLRELGRLRHGLLSSSSTGRRSRGRRPASGSASPREFVKRGGFVLMACLAAARQGRSRQELPGPAAAHREGRSRRAQLREEGRELGAARHRAARISRSTRRRWRWPSGWRSRRRPAAAGSAKTRCASWRVRSARPARSKAR